MDANKILRQHKFTMADLARYQGESLLVVLHGSHTQGWNKRRSDQKIVLLDAMDDGVKEMRLWRGSLKPASIGEPEEGVPPPLLIGDAILITLRGEGTAIYRDGTRYRWYPVDDAYS